MKKFLILASIVFVNTFLLAGCQNNSQALKVGMDLKFPPFETVDTHNKPEGISVDIANAFGNHLDRSVKIVNLDFADLILALQTGEIDVVIGSMSDTAERRKTVDFSDTYMYFKIITLVNKSFAETHALTQDSSYLELLAIEGARYVGVAAQVSSQIPESYGKQVTEFTNLHTAIEEVAQGTADILLMSANPVVEGWRAHQDTTIVLWDPFVASPIAMAFKKGNDELRASANDFIAHLRDEGGVYETIASKWHDVLIATINRDFSFYTDEK